MSQAVTNLVYSTSTESAALAAIAERRRHQHAAIVQRMVYAADDAADRAQHRTRTGRCTACGSIEVALNRVSHVATDGTPQGWGCEVCD